MGACNAQSDPVSCSDYKLTGCSPTGVEQFGRFIARGKQNLAYLCNDDVVAILYDCENRIPLYSATMINGQHLNAGYGERPSRFKQSPFLEPEFQASDDDYKGSLKVQICYLRDPNTRPALIDSGWYEALNPGKAMKPNQPCSSVLTDEGPIGTRHHARRRVLRGKGVKQRRSNPQKAKRDDQKRKPTPTNTMIKLTTSIQKGHLIAAQYGRGNNSKILATFTYTNTIPQFGAVNSGAWRVRETALINWGRKHCAEHDNVRMFIIAGAIPSTVRWTQKHRFFGKKRFSNYQSKREFRINVPIAVWTAACCTFHFKGSDKQGTFHTFFALENYPRAVNFFDNPRNFFKMYTSTSIDLFPSNRDCSEEGNYRSLRN